MSCEEQRSTIDGKLSSLTTELEQEAHALEEEVKEEAKAIDPDIDTEGPDAWIGFDVDIAWERVDFSLDLPEVKVVNQKWSLDVPQVTMKEEAVIFHTPSIRMKTVRGPNIPEIVCKMKTRRIGPIKTKVPECKTRQKKTFFDVPETFLEEQRIVINVPEFRMDRAEMLLGVPEFSMRTQSFALHLPQVTVKNMRVEAGKAKDAGDALSEDARRRGEELRLGFAATAKAELGTEVSDLYACYRRQVDASKNEALQSFESGAAGIQAAIASMVSSKVPDDNENLRSARESLAQLNSDRDAFVEQIQKQMNDLAEQERTFFENLTS